MAKKFKEAQARLFKNMFVCRKCKHKVRSITARVLGGKTKCRYCNSTAFRPKKRDKKAV